MRRSYIMYAVLIALSGCVSGQGPHATIDDLDGLRVVAVDDMPVERVSHPYISMVPFATVEPGSHTLSIEPESHKELPEPTYVVKASFEAGKRYRIQLENGTPTVVEDRVEDVEIEDAE